MKCPNCNNEFAFNWKTYFIASFSMNRFKTPCCRENVKLKSTWSYVIIVGSLSFLYTVIGGYIFLTTNNYLVKILIILILLVIFYVDKGYDSRRELLLREKNT